MLKVAALRLFHPAVSSVLFGTGFCYCDTVSDGKGDFALFGEKLER